MTWIQTYDPARNPAQWTDLVCPGQYAVFVLDASTRVVCDTEGRRFTSGESASIALCGDLPEAVSFARDVVTRNPKLCCEVYDHEGKSKRPLHVIYNPAVRGKFEGLRYSKRLALGGSLTVLCGAGFLVYDLTRDLTWLWGYIIGLKLAVTGGFCLARGLVGVYEHRGESSNA